MTVYSIGDQIVFPPADWARPDGLLAVGGDLSVPRLLTAYRLGIFPWFNEGDPILWWSPDPRMAMFPDEFYINRRFRRLLKKGDFSITMDAAFSEVVDQCAYQPTPSRESTWITLEMREAYQALFEAGYAHSVECWRGGQLAGGLYGVAIGRCFFGESMFSAAPNGSKVALAYLTAHLRQWRFEIIDCQLPTHHLKRLGAREIPRSEYLKHLRRGTAIAGPASPWQVETSPLKQETDIPLQPTECD